jgi:outer membrane protein TolC
VSLVEVLDADLRLLATRDARAVARTTAARASVAAFKALGGGWSSDSTADEASAKPVKSAPPAEQRPVSDSPAIAG